MIDWLWTLEGLAYAAGGVLAFWALCWVVYRKHVPNEFSNKENQP